MARIVDIFGRLGALCRILDCSELRYRYLSITVEPPECLSAGANVPVHACPEVLPLPSDQEIPNEPEAHTWVCDCRREGGLLCGAKFSTKKQRTTHIMHTQGEDSWITFVEHARNNYQCMPRGVSSSSPTTLQRYVTYRNDWKLALRHVQKVRAVNMKQSLRRLCLVFWNVQKTTLVVATRGAISFNLQQNCVPCQNVPFLIYCVASEKKDDHSVFAVLGLFRFSLRLWFQCQCLLRSECYFLHSQCP